MEGSYQGRDGPRGLCQKKALNHQIFIDKATKISSQGYSQATNLGYIMTHPKRAVSQCNGNNIDIHSPENFSDLNGILLVQWHSTGMTIKCDGVL
jgi:hypothetical protein